MGIVLGLLPFIAVSLLSPYVGPTFAVGIGASIAAALVLHSWLSSHSLKILETGAALLLLGLMLYSALARTPMSSTAVRLAVHGGLLLIILFSLAIRQPFTLQYARAQVDPRYWASPRFVHSNDVITAGWAAAFALIVAVDTASLLVPTIPLVVNLAVVLGALAGAAAFSSWYAARARHAATADVIAAQPSATT